MNEFELAQSLESSPASQQTSSPEVDRPRSPPHKAIIQPGEKVSDVFISEPFQGESELMLRHQLISTNPTHEAEEPEREGSQGNAADILFDETDQKTQEDPTRQQTRNSRLILENELPVVLNDEQMSFAEEESKLESPVTPEVVNSPEQYSCHLSDYQILEEVGAGSFGIVRLVMKNNQKYALKELSKQRVIETGKKEAVFRERDFLYLFNHPAFPKIYQTFQDETNLYFLLEHVPNGALSTLLRQQEEEKLPNELCRFYAAWLVIALEYLHSQKIVHRDLKPQNILIGEDLYLKIIDFGDSKQINEEEEEKLNYEEFNHMMNRGSHQEGSFFSQLRDSVALADNKIREGTFVGTPLYVAPEMLDGNRAGRFTDLWALGCIIYQFHVGTTPFQGKSQDQVFQKIQERDLKLPRTLDADTRDLIDKLLDYTPDQRLGMKSYSDLKRHPYFKNIDFDKLQKRSLPVPCQQVFSTGMRTLATESDDPNTFSMVDPKQTHLQLSPGFVAAERFDACCRNRIDVDQIVMEGSVKVRRKLFFYKRRQLILLEDGQVFVIKHGHISNEIKLNKYTEISHQCEGGHCRFLISTPQTYEYVECENGDLVQTWVNILLKIRRLVVDEQRKQKKIQTMSKIVAVKS